jgi:hypothetical protein
VAQSGLLSPEQAKGAGRAGLIQAGLAALAASGRSTQKTGLAQILGQGIAAGQQGYQQAAGQAIQADQMLTQRIQEEQRKKLLAQFATGSISPESMQRLFMTQLANGASAGELQATAEVIKYMHDNKAAGRPAMDLATADNGTTRSYYLKDWQGPGDPRSPDSPVIYKEPIDARPKTPSEVAEATKFRADQTNKILDDYRADIKEPALAATGYKGIMAALHGDPTAAQTFVLLDNFARLNNPGAVVRTSTFDVLQSMGSLKTRMGTLINKAVSSGELDPELRTMIFRQAQAVAADHMARARYIIKAAKNRAARDGINIDDLIVDPFSDVPDTSWTK